MVKYDTWLFYIFLPPIYMSFENIIFFCTHMRTNKFKTFININTLVIFIINH